MGETGQRESCCRLSRRSGRTQGALRSTSFRCPAKQRHTAGCPAFEVRITYPFHPRSGESVAVVGSRRHAGVEHLIIRQPDRSLALLPGWMTEAGASPRPLLSSPRFPVERLADLRALLDVLMASYAGDSSCCEGAGHARSAPCSEGPVRRSNTDTGAPAGVTDQAGTAAPGASEGGGQGAATRVRAGSPDRGGRR